MQMNAVCISFSSSIRLAKSPTLRLYPVETVYDNTVERGFTRVLHHCAKLRTVEVFSRKALVLVHEDLIVMRFGEVGRYVFAAELYLVAYALALTREFGFSGIYRDLH